MEFAYYTRKFELLGRVLFDLRRLGLPTELMAISVAGLLFFVALSFFVAAIMIF